MNHPEKSHTSEDSAKEIGQGAMKPEEADEEMLRKCLLGELSDEEQTALELRLMTEGLLFEQLKSLEDELIDDYLAGTLKDAEKERFERRAAQHPGMQKRIEFTRTLKRSVNQRRNIQAIRLTQQPIRPIQRVSSYRAYFKIAAIVLIAVGAVFVLWRVVSPPSATDEGLAELRRLYQGNRPLEARLSGFNYAPFAATRGGKSGDDVRARDRIALKLHDAAEREPGAKSLNALGNYYLTEKQFDKALPQFEAALKLDPNNAQLHNDYGAALLETAKALPHDDNTGKRLENLARAQEHFSRAVELNNSLLEALFNRALCQQLLNLPEQAKKAWREYLEKDSSSPWADEARQHLQGLEAQKSTAKTPSEVLPDFFAAYEQGNEERAWEIVSQTKEMITGVMVFFQLAQGFLEADANRENEKADKYLAALRYVGELEKKEAGDVFFSELAEFYASADRANRQILFQAQNEIKTGYRLTQESKYSEAITAFRQAGELFAKTGNHWESKVSNYWIGSLYHRAGKVDAAVKEFSALEQYCLKNKYQWVHAQALGWLGQSAFGQNEISKADNYLKRALKITKQISDTYNQQKVLARLGSHYSRTGKFQKALALIEESIKTKQDYFSSSRQTWRNYNSTAEILYRFKLYNSAIYFGQEALQIGTEKMTDSAIEHTSYYTLSALYGGLQRYSEALEFAKNSLLSIESVKASDKRLLTNFSFLRTAHLYRQSGECEESLKMYETVIRETAEEGTVQIALNNYEAHKGRLLCYFALNKENLIADELPVVMNLYEKYRTQILDEQTRNSFFDNEQSVYDLAINFEYSRKNLKGAFDDAEISKARSLLDLFHVKGRIEKDEKELNVRLNQVASPLSFDEIRNRLPEQAQVVQYAVLSDKVLIWVFTRTQFSVVEKRISSSEIAEKVNFYLKDITEKNQLDPQANLESARQLYDILINPVLPLLDGSKQICFIPDKSLYQLPFAALISPANGRFLIEDFTIFSAPSATLMLLSSESAARKGSEDKENILSVGNPRFDKWEFSELADLPDAEREAVKITEFYQTPKTLIRDAADKQAFLSELTRSNVIHFAGHYVVDESLPLRSKLLLAVKKEKQSGDVEVHEILERDLSLVRLAVLSACQTGIENYYNGEGMTGISRSFLAGGVPLVVASQWAVDSGATAELMVKFHSYRKQHNLSSAEALRRAQIEMLSNSNQRFNSPYYWAGFLPLGGFTNY